jgi:hypothetical protein
MKIHSWEAQLFHANEQTVMIKLTVVIRNFTNAPKIYVYGRRLCKSTNVK